MNAEPLDLVNLLPREWRALRRQRLIMSLLCAAVAACSAVTSPRSPLPQHADDAMDGRGMPTTSRTESVPQPQIQMDLEPEVEPRESDRSSLADRALAWALTRRDGPFRFNPRVARKKGWPLEEWVREELVPAAVEAAMGATYPRWPDPELLLAKAWWESRWKPDEVGRFVRHNGRIVPGVGGELGVMQIKPRICARYTRTGEDCADTRVNMRIAATILREHLATCEGRPRYALRFYGSGRGCAPPRRAEKTVFVWAQQIRGAPEEE